MRKLIESTLVTLDGIVTGQAEWAVPAAAATRGAALREVLGFSAEEIGSMLEMTPPAVKSALQRARAALDERMPRPESMTEPSQPEAKAVLDAYMDAFERSDADALERLLCDDAILEMTPARTWFAGKKTCAPYLRNRALGTTARRFEPDPAAPAR